MTVDNSSYSQLLKRRRLSTINSMESESPKFKLAAVKEEVTILEEEPLLEQPRTPVIGDLSQTHARLDACLLRARTFGLSLRRAVDAKLAAAEGKLAEKDAAILDLWQKVETSERRILGLEGETARLLGEKEQLRIEAVEQVKGVAAEAEVRETGLRDLIKTLGDECTDVKVALSSAQEEVKAKDQRIRALKDQVAEAVRDAEGKKARISALEVRAKVDQAAKARLEMDLWVNGKSLENAQECIADNERLFNKWRPKIYQAGYDLCVERALSKVGTQKLASKVTVPPGWWGDEGECLPGQKFTDYGDSELEDEEDDDEDEEDEDEFDDDEDVGLGLEDVVVETNKEASSSKKD